MIPNGINGLESVKLETAGGHVIHCLNINITWTFTLSERQKWNSQTIKVCLKQRNIALWCREMHQCGRQAYLQSLIWFKIPGTYISLSLVLLRFIKSVLSKLVVKINVWLFKNFYYVTIPSTTCFLWLFILIYLN